MDGSFTLDDLERSNIEGAARPGLDELFTCTCVELVYVRAAETPARAIVQTNSALPVAIQMEP